MIIKAVKRPIIIEAVQWDGDNLQEVLNFTRHKAVVSQNAVLRYGNVPEPSDTNLSIPTLEGMMLAKIGDYIIKGVQDELYPCKKDIFEETYEVLHDDTLGVQIARNTLNGWKA